MIMRIGLLLVLVWTQASAQKASPPEAPHVLYINADRHAEAQSHMQQWLANTAQLQPRQWTRVKAIDGAAAIAWADEPGQTQHLEVRISSKTKDGSSTEAPCLHVLTWLPVADSSDNWAAPTRALSHAKAIATAFAMGLKEAVILEDDVDMVYLFAGQTGAGMADNWRYLRQMLDSLPKSWNILQLSSTAYHDALPIPAFQATADEVHERHTLWSKRDHCIGSGYRLRSTNAYVISRAGMLAFLERYLRSFLQVPPQEAHDFCGYLDFRHSILELSADTLIQDMDGVFVSHLPLFATKADAAAINAMGSGGAHANVRALHRSIQALRQAGILMAPADNVHVKRALESSHKRYADKHQALQRMYREMQRGIVETKRSHSFLLPDLGLMSLPSSANGGLTERIAVDISTQETRSYWYIGLERCHGMWVADMWQAITDGYLDQCGGRMLLGDADWSPFGPHEPFVTVVVPIAGNLRAIAVPVSADKSELATRASAVCGSVSDTAQAVQQCSAALQQRMAYVLKLAEGADSAKVT